MLVKHLEALFSEKLNGSSFEIMIPMGRRLVKPILTPESSLCGSTLSTLFSQKTVYLRPLTSTLDVLDTLDIIEERPLIETETVPNITTNDNAIEIEEVDDKENQMLINKLLEEDMEIGINKSLDQGLTFMDTLNWYKSQINQEEMTYFNIYREDIYNCCKRALRRKTFSPWNRISVLFTDISNVTEGAIDLGGPTREMFRLLLGYLKNSKIFEGDEYSKNLRFCNESLDNREYFEVGRIICLSIIHVGFGPCYLSNTLLTYLLHGSEFAKPDPSEIVDPDVHKDIEGVQNSTTLDELRNMVLDSQFFQIAGFRNVTNFDQKNQIVERTFKEIEINIILIK